MLITLYVHGEYFVHISIGYSTTTRAVWFILLEHEGRRPEGAGESNTARISHMFLQIDDITGDYHGELLTSCIKLLS